LLESTPTIPLRPIASFRIRLLVVVGLWVVVIPRVPRKDLKARVLGLLSLVPTRVVRDTVAPRRVVRRRRRHIRPRRNLELWSLRHCERRMCLRNPGLVHHSLFSLSLIHDRAEIRHFQVLEERLEANTLPETSACFVHLRGDKAHHLSIVVDATVYDGRVLRVHEVGWGILVALATVLLLLEVIVVAVFEPAVTFPLAGPAVCCYAIVTPGCGCGLWRTRECSESWVRFDDGLIVIACLPCACRARGFDSEFRGVVAEDGGDEDFVVCLGFAVLVAGEFADCVFSCADLANFFVFGNGAFGFPVGGAFCAARSGLVMRVTVVTFFAGALFEILGLLERGHAMGDGAEDVVDLLDIVGNKVRAATGTEPSTEGFFWLVFVGVEVSGHLGGSGSHVQSGIEGFANTRDELQANVEHGLE
jgi:hypothetical protein